MTKKHKPDHEMGVMRRTLRELTALTPAGRSRALTYLAARIDALPPPASERNGEQQLDIEEVNPPRGANA